MILATAILRETQADGNARVLLLDFRLRDALQLVQLDGNVRGNQEMHRSRRAY